MQNRVKDLFDCGKGLWRGTLAPRIWISSPWRIPTYKVESTGWLVTDTRKGKGQFAPITGHKAQEGGVKVQLYSFLNLGASGRWWWVVNATPRPLYPRERPGTHCIGGWVGHRAGVDGCGKSCPPPPPGFNPRNVQPVASRYTD